MKTESILFLLAIHEDNELRDDLGQDAYDELVIAGLLDGTEITEKGYAYVRHLSDVPVPVQVWADPRSLASPMFPPPPDVQYLESFEKALAYKREAMQKSVDDARLTLPGVKVNVVLKDRLPADLREEQDAAEAARGRLVDIVPAGYSGNPGHLPGGVDRAADIQIVRANGKRKTIPAQAINWTDVSTPDRVIGWRYAPAGGEARIHTPGETMPAPAV